MRRSVSRGGGGLRVGWGSVGECGFVGGSGQDVGVYVGCFGVRGGEGWGGEEAVNGGG